MTTKLKPEQELKREIVIDSTPHTVTISSSGITITQKRRRAGVTVTWSDVVDLGYTKRGKQAEG